MATKKSNAEGTQNNNVPATENNTAKEEMLCYVLEHCLINKYKCEPDIDEKTQKATGGFVILANNLESYIGVNTCIILLDMMKKHNINKSTAVEWYLSDRYIEDFL